MTSHAHQNLIFVSAGEKRREARAHSNVHYPFRPDHDPFFRFRPVLPTADPPVPHAILAIPLPDRNSTLRSGWWCLAAHETCLEDELSPGQLDAGSRIRTAQLNTGRVRCSTVPGISLDTRIGSLCYRNHIPFCVSYDGTTVRGAISAEILYAR